VRRESVAAIPHVRLNANRRAFLAFLPSSSEYAKHLMNHKATRCVLQSRPYGVLLTGDI
jgi:hypothetical protein